MSHISTGAADIESLRNELLRPGRTLVFIDDSGTPEQPLGEHLVKDYKLHVAAVLTSNAYGEFLTRHGEFLARYPWATEFHAAEIFQGRRAPWSEQSEEERRRAFHTMAGYFARFVSRVLYIGVGTEQYEDIVQGARAAGALYPFNVAWDSHSEGARIALLKAIANRTGLPSSQEPLVVVEDSDGQRQDCCEVMFQRSANIYSDGVFRVDSRAVPGIQLADLAAYCFNRLHHVRAKLKTARPTRELDPSLMRFLSENIGKYRDALLHIPSEYEERRARNQRKRERRARR